MINFKQYFRSHLKANLKALIYILTAVLIFTWLLGVTYQKTTVYREGPQTAYQSTLYLPVIFMCVLVYIIPVMEFSFFKKRINLDCAYSLPISRKAMGVVHYLVGLIMLLGSFSASYLLNFIMLLSHGSGWYNFLPMIAHYCICLALGFAIYSFMVFVFNQGNTRGDGIWFMILYTFVFNIGLNAIAKVLDIKLKYALGALPWHVFTKINQEYQSLVELIKTDKSTFSGSFASKAWFTFWMILGIASAVALFFTFGKRRMEKTEEISDSCFGFKMLIPLYAISAMIVYSGISNIFIKIIIGFLTFIGYTVYRRGFHYKKSDIAILCLLLLFLFV